MKDDSRAPGANGARPLQTILLAGFVGGALDIGYVLAYFHGASPVRILQGIAMGLLGPAATRGGLATAALGLLLQFTIATGAAAVFYAASRWLGFLTRWPLVTGPLYGVAVWLFMNLVVLPLSSVPQAPLPRPHWPAILVAHLVCVGLPIALITARARGGAPARARSDRE